VLLDNLPRNKDGFDQKQAAQGLGRPRQIQKEKLFLKQSNLFVSCTVLCGQDRNPRPDLREISVRDGIY
jgi:hypothetical protein